MGFLDLPTAGFLHFYSDCCSFFSSPVRIRGAFSGVDPRLGFFRRIGSTQVTLPPRARRRSLARAFVIAIVIAIVTPLRRRSLACPRASARALAAPSFRHCSQRPPPTRAPTTLPIARADDRSDRARRRRADARADARALATAPAPVPTPVPTPSHVDAPADAIPDNHANTLADDFADALPDSPSRGRARVVVLLFPSRQCERGFPSLVHALVGTVVFYINNGHQTSSTFRTPQPPQNTEIQYSSSTVQAPNRSKMLLVSPAAGCVGPFGEHAHLPKPLVLAARVGIVV